MPQDIELEDNVKAALARDPRVDHDQAIAVFASAGVVTLRGSVESFKPRHAAVEDAHAVTGVDAGTPASTRPRSAWRWPIAGSPSRER
jgi:osmotically-inducible protein OsmY